MDASISSSRSSIYRGCDGATGMPKLGHGQRCTSGHWIDRATVRPMSKLMTSDVTGSLWSGDKDHTQVATIIRRKGKFKISILGLSLREH